MLYSFSESGLVGEPNSMARLAVSQSEIGWHPHPDSTKYTARAPKKLRRQHRSPARKAAVRRETRGADAASLLDVWIIKERQVLPRTSLMASP